MESLTYHAVSEQGRRERNEDAFLAERIGRFHVFAVADGMGGHAAGDVASTCAIGQLRTTVITSAADDPMQAVLERAFANANRKIFEYNKKNALNAGTTLTALLIDEAGKCVFANVGDSRASVFDETGIWQTRDHSLVRHLVDLGLITPDEAMTHPRKNILERALGLQPDVAVDFYPQECSKRTIVLSSDGLHDTIPPERIRILARAYPPREAAAALTAECLRDGGTDNITVIVIRVS
ncbi:MAG: hypothetical protein APR53_04455 [Methanoculleus sp. SDB]|nr:MAG: hypothetical protein APR53_04455 [Methanoculleus sp. SDB]